ncbi:MULTISPECIES: CaiB/BaiF CoA transferase family protein [Mycolicibacterium]|jgi:crotonobetainyl-CoA:carnitine CoA-transferase CaiB-like acyl-CoA transferase|uniref:L-carnitine dehydratase/bile acid-inducible protein F n=1 Tax=Mycolicibacterium vanbaalenii (strain DSM 7251 / JCM 13017 / BCRC 16820 / KCTC 9966 / NRRL B-24157 / PYR-1) TaxID=350058 RepID=A1T793_MYCVP|nr:MULTISPECIES: CoA transferase [Mycolicibacterium]ABM13043.1 L-carnitine dehydratase/bile acid-inducible protein F [Mycolicibacterium vanbaalenii PYR-1]MCV7127493.1 CoA transferase [Mycolicibacterium vanbaalenii PYR-1]MDW5613622.1 CoA transferase [Mycolicibacterium sp. D5.8-2]QZT59026.1 CoA transferase [Mycolicibacterium austroafricanum]QZY48284.1 CoA transferase [Mycolicibacterium austroafricanum]
MAGPLEGLRVVELGVWVAGPAAGGILADWGADVVKIEPPGGDPARTFGRMLGIQPQDRHHVSPPFQMDNRGKRSVVLDLATADGQSSARELLAGADVFLTNIRTGALRRIGLDFPAVAAANPQLIYGLITGYGSDGPDADRPAYDVAAFWARSGLAHLLTRPGEAPPFQRGGMGDHMAGMTLAGAVCAALVARARTGAGQLVSTSLYRQGAYTVSFDLNTFLLTGHPIAIGQRETMGNPCMNNYTAADGRRFWLVGLQGERHWPALCAAVERTDWLSDERFATGRARAANAVELIAELDTVFAGKTLEEWAEVFSGQPDLFWSPINSMEDVIADEQFHASGGIVYVPDSDGGAVPMVATPADFHGTPAEVRCAAPELGEHTEEVLAELAQWTNRSM